MERLHVSVSRRSLFPLLMALFGALLCIGMVQRFRDPLYDMTLEYWLYLAAGCFMVLVGLVGMRFFPWMVSFRQSAMYTAVSLRDGQTYKPAAVLDC